VSKYFIQETIWFLIIKAIADSVFMFTIGWRADSNILIIQLAWVIPYVVLTGILIRVVAVTILNKPNVVAYSIVLIILMFSFPFGINICQSFFDQSKKGVFITCQQ
jgi:high-affinity Fe2+/Pb2+ permease